MAATGLPRKSRLWQLNPSSVDPRWAWAHRGIVLAVPFWEGGGIPRDYGPHKRKNLTQLNSPAWVRTRQGMATDHSGTASGAGNAKVWRVPHFAAMDVTELTMLVVANVIGPFAVSDHYANYGSTTAGTWAIATGSGAGDEDEIAFQVRVNGGTARAATSTGTANSLGLHTYALTYKNPNLLGYIDGVQRASESTGGALDTNQGTFYLGGHPAETGESDEQRKKTTPA